MGPLSLRQFIFALIAAFLFYICFLAVTKHVPFMLAVFLPPALFCAFFAFPWGRDQPTELWALAKIRFWFKPRKRVWNQSGVKELVTINVPKKVERILTDNLSQTEVKSRLEALANTIDSRGWAIKHIDAVGYSMPSSDSSSDRLIDIPEEAPPQEVPADLAVADIMDTDTNPIAKQFDTMINQSTQEYRQRLINQLSQPAAATPPQAQPQQWFMDHNPVPGRPAPAVSAPAAAPTLPTAGIVPSAMPADPEVIGGGAATAADDVELSAQLKKRADQPKEYGHLRTLQPTGTKPATDAPPVAAATAPAAGGQASDDSSTGVTASNDPAILSLSKNDDLNVATIAREAQRTRPDSRTSGEVVISLH